MSKQKEEIIKKSFDFFSNMLENCCDFSLYDVSSATGWSQSTVRTYKAKKWVEFLIDSNKSRYKVDGRKFRFTVDEYVRFMSQVQKYSREPSKPVFDERVNLLIRKSRESAILAVDTYNRPSTSFRSQGFIVLMIIAWTALLHAIFEKDGIDYFYREKDGNISIIDGEKKPWELSKSIEKYKEISEATKKNLHLFIKLRNMIEHRFVPQFDIEISGECQAMLLNYEDMLFKKFGNYYSLNETLTIPLQLIRTRASWQNESISSLQKEHYDELKSFLSDYRKDLPNEVYSDMEFSFRVYLVAKTGNNRSSSDVAVEFVKYDNANSQYYEEIEKNIILIKEKKVQVANLGKHKPSSVVDQVNKRINVYFNINIHTKAWKIYEVRGQGKDASNCKVDFCQFDVAHNDYVYTDKWIEFLCDKLLDELEYNKIIMYKEHGIKK